MSIHKLSQIQFQCHCTNSSSLKHQILKTGFLNLNGILYIRSCTFVTLSEEIPLLSLWKTSIAWPSFGAQKCQNMSGWIKIQLTFVPWVSFQRMHIWRFIFLKSMYYIDIKVQNKILKYMLATSVELWLFKIAHLTTH